MIKDQVQIRKWVHRGKMLIATDALDATDPDHPYNQIIAQGAIPEEFGVYHPNSEEFKNMSRTNLINMIVDLRREIEAYARGDMEKKIW